MEERYTFFAEWYDPHAALIRKYQLLYYPTDQTCEMVDIKNRRLFLKRSKCPNIQLTDLFLGAVVNVHSRQLTISDFGDDFTRLKLQSKKEHTLGIIKPNCVSKLGEIFDHVLLEGLSICNLRMITLTTKEASKFYEEHQGKPFFHDLVVFMTEGPIIVFELIGEKAISRWRELLGPTDSTLARQEVPSSLRAQFGTDKMRNACHGSDSSESAGREINFFFGSSSAGTNTASFQNCTLCIIKPHAVKESLTGKIIKEIIASGLKITALGLFNVEKANAEEFYEVYKGVVREYTQMVEQLSSGPCVAMEITGEVDPHHTFRELTGPSDSEIARHLRPNTLRAKFGIDKIRNAVHCTDLPDDNILEVEYFFKILDY